MTNRCGSCALCSSYSMPDGKVLRAREEQAVSVRQQESVALKTQLYFLKMET